MMLENLTQFAKEAAPQIANHLWQSTLFAILAGLLTLPLQKNQARIRYGLWLAASMKFLVPFSLLIALGAHLAVPHAGMQTAYTIVEQASQPFTQHAATAVPTSDASPLLPLLPAGLALVWLTGFVAVLGRWSMRWRQVSDATQTASPISSGLEVETLRHLERAAGLAEPITFLLSQDSMEPGIFGIVRPVLLWPAGISEHLHDTHLKAILAHEVCHVRRRDNLAAAVHMLVEAIFWFYPLVWWLGARLIDERERACDEAVLEIGTGPEVYAESILKACEFCVESPLSCVSGVTGSDLKKRIVRIMTQQFTDQLTPAKKLVLAAFGTAAIAVPIAFGIVYAPGVSAQSLQRIKIPLPSVEVVTLKQNLTGEKGAQVKLTDDRLTATNWTVRAMIKLAYHLNDNQISGGPAWIDSARYDVDVKAKDTPANEEGIPPLAEPGHPLLLLQTLLADRFNLRLSQETRDLPIYTLVVADSGPKLVEMPMQTMRSNPQDHEEPIVMMRTKIIKGKGELTINGPISALADQLSTPLGRQVVDKTGLTGSYYMTLQWTPGEDQEEQTESISTALQDRFGLVLTPQQGPVEVSVIDQIEQPSTN
jgi:bla regulator protein BlaR1